MLGEVPVDTSLEDLRQRQDVQHADRVADDGRVARLVRVAHRLHASTDRQDGVRPHPRVQHFLGRVLEQLAGEMAVPRATRDLSEDQPAVQLGRAIEVEEAQLALGYLRRTALE